jgi:hypothetical protein
MRELDGGNGYAGQSSARVHVGIGGATTIDSVEIRWPAGGIQQLQPHVDTVSTITEPPPQTR